MRLKICHIISGDLWAGAEVMAFQLLRGLSKLPGVDLSVILLNKGRLSDELESAAIPTVVLDENQRSFIGIIGQAARILKDKEPQILHSHRYKENILSYLVSFALRKKAALVSTQHGIPELYAARPGLLNRLKLHANYKLLATKFARTVAVSSDIRESLIRDYGIREDRLATIRNGITVPDVAIRPRKSDRLVIGSAGRLFPVKDFPFMVEIAKAVHAKNDHIRFELAGEGPRQCEIQGLITRYGLDDCFVLRGFIRDVDSFYQGLDVYINTSIHEGIPMSVLEAMAHGVPPIVPRVGGMEEIVTDGVDGYLVDTRSPLDFSERCLSLYKNESLRQNMACAAREKIISQFSIEHMVNAYLEMYRRATENCGPGSEREQRQQ